MAFGYVPIVASTSSKDIQAVPHIWITPPITPRKLERPKYIFKHKSRDMIGALIVLACTRGTDVNEYLWIASRVLEQYCNQVSRWCFLVLRTIYSNLSCTAISFCFRAPLMKSPSWLTTSKKLDSHNQEGIVFPTERAALMRFRLNCFAPVSQSIQEICLLNEVYTY